MAERAGRGHGPVRIRHDLRQRGVSDALAAEYLEADPNQWRSGAQRARHKRFGAAPPANAGERARQMRFLHQRGFDHEQIRHALGGEDLDGDDDWI